MCFISVYKRLKKDFEFLNEYGYEYKCDVKHNVQPSVEFVKGNYSLLIGFAYDEDRFFVSYFDVKVRQYPSEWNLSAQTLFKDGWPKPIYVVGEDTLLNGTKYKEQLDTVRSIVRNFLDNLSTAK